MSLLTINPDKCNRDGICADVCPMKIIYFKDKNTLPVPVPGADKLCIRCGHCVAVCSTGAMSHEIMSPEQCLPVKKEWRMTPEHAEHFFRYRRSIRVYQKKTVDREILAKLIELASYAPSGHNLQPVKWHVVYDSTELKRLTGLVADWMRYMIKEQPDMANLMHMDLILAGWDAGVDVICRDAPHLIIAHGSSADTTAQTSCTIALTYLDLAAPPLGLGTCWGGFFQAAATFWPPLQKALDFPKGNVSYGAMMVGYSKYRYQRMPLRNKPQVTWL
jgi:nitroreductase/NAD-dependent dihydropyrimidine dehydrogenase PreA subunit